ncbi:unnamed protein product [Mycena citricolor]|uniref:Uncharacterized protein n=1 Tax=Mycena citricolor TaxID=2018698 RepID=A0AAD2Q4F7_9AGAR|nr:unnamed protein product [Mycena citricolor]
MSAAVRRHATETPGAAGTRPSPFIRLNKCICSPRLEIPSDAAAGHQDRTDSTTRRFGGRASGGYDRYAVGAAHTAARGSRRRRIPRLLHWGV